MTEYSRYMGGAFKFRATIGSSFLVLREKIPTRFEFGFIALFADIVSTEMSIEKRDFGRISDL